MQINHSKRTSTGLSLLVAIILSSYPSFGNSQTKDIYSLSPGEGCATQVFYNQQMRDLWGAAAASAQACAMLGSCDDPAERDSFIPDSTTTMKIIPLYIHVMRNDDGSNAAASASDVDEQIILLNQDFAPYRVRFNYQMRFVNSTQYRNLNTNGEFSLMKAAYAIEPARFLNIYVASVNVNGSVFSFGHFPWGSPLSTAGGIVMNRTQFFPFGGSTLTHEVGHNLALYHTHNGVDEVAVCGTCYEPAQGTGRDVLGDRCSDTDPTPTNFGCNPPGGLDDCNDLPWGTTHFRNFMSYAPQSCRTEFSPQQAGRMHCWIEDRLSSWLLHAEVSPDDVFGAVPLTVNFTGDSPHQVSNWRWDFGDGDSAFVQNPSHDYGAGGVYSVNVEIDALDDSTTYANSFNNLIYAMADTFEVEHAVGGPGERVRVDISINNAAPLYGVTIPFTWLGPLALTFDTVETTGLRTSNLSLENGGIFEKNNDFGNRRAIRSLVPPSGEPIPPGNGPILSLYFKTPPFVIPGVNPINIISYGLTNPEIEVDPGVYLPAIENGSVVMGCCSGAVGNVDGGFGGVVDIADLTFLIDVLFINFPEPACVEEANIDGDPLGVVDISDLTVLIDHLFINFPVLADCR